MLLILKTAVQRLPIIFPKYGLFNQSAAMFHALLKPNAFNFNGVINKIPDTQFLAPITPIVVPNCGFKVKGRLKRRCKDCYFVVRQQRLYVICKTHPRHKQMAMVPREKNTWTITHATQGQIRPW